MLLGPSSVPGIQAAKENGKQALPSTTFQSNRKVRHSMVIFSSVWQVFWQGQAPDVITAHGGGEDAARSSGGERSRPPAEPRVFQWDGEVSGERCGWRHVGKRVASLLRTMGRSCNWEQRSDLTRWTFWTRRLCLRRVKWFREPGGRDLWSALCGSAGAGWGSGLELERGR